MALAWMLVAVSARAQSESTAASPPPFVVRELQNPAVTIAVTNAPTETVKFGGYPPGTLPVLTYSRTQKAPTNVLFGVAFTYGDSGGTQRQAFLTLRQPHTLSNSTGTITSSEIENFQLNLTLAEQVRGDGILTVALFDAVASTNKDFNAGATTGGNRPMTFYSDRQKTSASYGRQISNVLKLKATVWHPF